MPDALVASGCGTDQLAPENARSVDDVIRAYEVQVEGLDPLGESIKVRALDYEAVVFQHELDHLDGILFLDRISNVKTDLFRRKPR